MEEVARSGANIINIHQGNELNPYINYPFLTVDKLKPYVDQAHQRGIKVKLYYTIRELSNHTAELWALRSLGHEVYRQGRASAWRTSSFRSRRTKATPAPATPGLRASRHRLRAGLASTFRSGLLGCRHRHHGTVALAQLLP